MKFKIIEYKTPEYEEMVDLRHRVLRAPIGLKATEEELAQDENYILLGAFFPNQEQLVACCFLSKLDDDVAQLRQMAVEDSFQKKGVGRQLVNYAEQVARENNYKRICLHARKTAIDFYKKIDYQTKGDYFIEVGIPHIKMIKNIEE